MARGRKTMPKKTGRALATAGTSVKSGRRASIKRTTKETDIEVAVNLDGKGVSNISTGVGFFDHMLDLLARHSRDRKSTRLNSSHGYISYAVFCLKKKNKLTIKIKAMKSTIKHKQQRT